SPLKPWDNRKIWERCTPQDFDLVSEVYRDIDYNRVIYLSDTGRTWNPHHYNLRDTTGVSHPYRAETTDELITLIRQTDITQLCLLTHPERWQDAPLAWAFQTLRDLATNTAKVGLKAIYRR